MPVTAPVYVDPTPWGEYADQSDIFRPPTTGQPDYSETDQWIEAIPAATETETAAPESIPQERGGRQRKSGEQRADIQALRAVAVSLVLVNHLWPNAITGGYIGVDVFFVISGFLITSSLVSKAPRRPHDLFVFWGRRVRRLLPAACLVLIASLAGVVYWGPKTLIATTAHQALASAFYVQNWVLAGDATDYFAANQTHTAVQHYWSLSVEEQFYIVWPILILVLAWLVRRARWRFSVEIGLAAIVVASFAVSIWYTGQQPKAAYFVTYTRAWELAAGGLLAALVARGVFKIESRALRTILSWGGLIAIAVSAVLLNAKTPFPGAIAGLPVLGTMLVIWAASDGAHGSPWTLWRFPPIQWLGDISYSVYLWHWPIIIFAPAAFGHALTWQNDLIIIAAILLVSWLSKKLVEDTFRYRKGLVKSLPRTFIMGLCVMLLVVGATRGANLWLSYFPDHERSLIEGSEKSFPARCIGAGSLIYEGCPATAPNFLFVTPTDAKKNSWIKCNSFPPYDPVNCTFGADPANATARILVIGNSHATQWAPLLDTLGKKNGWAGTTLTASGCLPYIGMKIDYGADTDGCARLGEQMLAEATSGKYDLVIYSAWALNPIVGRPDHWQAVAESQQKVFDKLTQQGSKLLVIRDTPPNVVSIPDCVAANLTDLAKCDYHDLTATESIDAMYDIASQSGLPNVWTVSINDLLCSDGTCRAVIGGLITFHDDNHLSVDFANTLAPRVEPVLKEALG